MTDDDWADANRRTLGWLLASPPRVGSTNARRPGDALLILLHAGDGAISFALPAYDDSAGWRVLIETTEADSAAASLVPPAGVWRMPGHSSAVLQSLPK
jgi:hypothetical protein